jgi:hypothetical protein
MIVSSPAVMPVTTCVSDPIVAIPVLVLLQVPPPVPSTRLIVEPTQTLLLPVIAPGNGLTVTVVVA